MSTNSPESKHRQDPPPLAQYKSRREYEPQYGDYLVWSGWFTTWHGLIIDYDNRTNKLTAIVAGVPFILFTMDPSNFDKESIRLDLDHVRKAPNGKYAFQRHDQSQNAIIWYI